MFISSSTIEGLKKKNDKKISKIEVVDFSGTWNLNKAKSTLNDQFSMTPKQIILIQNNGGLAVEKHGSFQDQDYTISDNFTLDGKECINAGWMDGYGKEIDCCLVG